MQQSHTALRFSEQLYRRFLRAYPASHRLRFSDEMTQVFRDLCLEAYERYGAWGLARLWVGTLVDLLKTAVEARLRTAPLPTAEETLVVGGWSAILGGLTTFLFALTHASPDWIHWVFRLEWTWFAMGLFYSAGLLGLAAHRRSRHQPIGLGVVLGLAGAGSMLASGFLMFFLNRMWIAYASGLLVLGSGLIWIGVFTKGRFYALGWRILVLANGTLTVLLTLFVPFKYMGALFEGDTSTIALLMGAAWLGLGMALLRSRAGSRKLQERREVKR